MWWICEGMDAHGTAGTRGVSMSSAVRRLSPLRWMPLLLHLACTGTRTVPDGTPPQASDSDWTSRFVDEDNLDVDAYRDLTQAQLSDVVEYHRGRGDLLVDVDAWSTPEGTRYGAIGHHNTDGRAWAAHHDLTPDELQELSEQYRDMGHRPLDVEAYGVELED